MSVRGHTPNHGNYTQDVPAVTARMLSKSEAFQMACEHAGTPATSRQAAKWRNHKGKAWKAKGNIQG